MNKKEEAVRIITSTAKDYEEKLVANKFFLICRNNKSNKIDCFEMRFPRYSFQHLTGLRITPKSRLKSANDFYNACVNRKISINDIEYANPSYTEIKLKILPQLINFIHFSKMSVIFNNGRPLLKCDKVVGTTNFSLALIERNFYYVPVSCLNEDVRDFGDEIYQVIAVFSAELSAKTFSKIRSIAKGVNLNKITIPEKYSKMIDLKNYHEN